MSRLIEAVKAGSTLVGEVGHGLAPLHALGRLGQHVPAQAAAEVRAMEPSVPTRWAESAAPAVDISATALQAGTRRVCVS
ncbi:hypothetical protein ACIBK9_11955 [Nonomuraea sp. NPDC050227]|uniref:hypothetical protein n=1 Tax=Nonomuraea sp. NPDC050227 TaxID=3364360 RepID=UPI0037B5C7AD